MRAMTANVIDHALAELTREAWNAAPWSELGRATFLTKIIVVLAYIFIQHRKGGRSRLENHATPHELQSLRKTAD